MHQGEIFKDYLDRNNLSVKGTAEKMGVSRPSIYQYFKSRELTNDVLENITSALGVTYTDIWNSRESKSNAKGVGMLINNTPSDETFTEISPGRYRMKVKLVPEFAKAGYLVGYADPEFIEELPFHEITVTKYHKGTYMAFEVSGDSMDDGTINSIPDGCVVTGREIKRELWNSKLHVHKYPNWVFVHRTEGICVKQISSQDMQTGVLTLRSLNPDKDRYPDFDIKMDDLLQIYNVVKRELPY